MRTFGYFTTFPVCHKPPPVKTGAPHPLLLRHVNPKDHTVSNWTHSAHGTRDHQAGKVSCPAFTSLLAVALSPPPTFQLWQWGKKIFNSDYKRWFLSASNILPENEP